MSFSYLYIMLERKNGGAYDMKKRLCSLFLALVMLFSMTGCEEVLNIVLEEVEQGLLEGIEDATSGNDETTNNNASNENNSGIIGDVACRVHFINVDQGDSILIESEGEYMLIDAGENNQGEIVVNYLNSLGITTLDYIIGTHPHSDHIGGMDDVLDAFTIEKAILPNTTYNTKTYQSVLDGIAEQNTETIWAEVGATYTLGDASFMIIAPAKDDYTDPNDWSVGIKLVCGESSFVMCGDAEAGAEKDILATGIDLEADVLKCGHHGSSTSTSEAFLKAVNPTYAVISCGVNNKYGHPHAEVIARLEDDDVLYYRTDLLGTIIASTDGKNITWTSESGTIDSSNTKNDSSVETTYVLNIKGKKFHTTDCSYGKNISEDNRKEYTGTREELISQGYEACGSCKP